MTKELKAAIAIIVSQLREMRRVLEIGSRTTKNQGELGNLRELFPKAKYTGIDMMPGPGVDEVADASALPYKSASYDLVLCLETLEHAKRPWDIVAEAERVVEKNGVLLFSSQQNFPLHMHPSDYYRFTPYGLAELFCKTENKLMIAISPPFSDEVKLNPQHVIVLAWNGRPELKQRVKRALVKRASEINLHKPYRHRLQDGARYLKRGLEEVGYRTEIFFPAEK